MTASTTIPTSALSGTISNAQLANSAITIAGTSTSLGGSISQDTITGLSTTGLVKRTGANTLAIAASGTDYAPATSGSSLLYGNGSGGFSNVTIGTGVSFSGGTLSATGTGGTVTSVATSGSVNGITLTGGPITSTGTITLGGTLSGITNSQLTNNSITVTAGSGLSGGGTVALGGSTTLTNAGVTSLVQGSGVTLNASTGSISISANYNGTVTSVSVSGSNGIGTSITNATTTPSISLNLGAITPTSVSTGALTATGTTTLATSLTGVLQATSGVISVVTTTGTGSVTLNTSPALAGVPTAPTAVASTNNSQIATTQFVTSAILYQTINVNSQSTGNYTLITPNDQNSLIYHPATDTNARTFTIPNGFA